MKIALTFVLLFAIGAARADSPVACLAPDVVETLLGFPMQGTPAFSTDVPAGTRLPDLPASLELIGSRRSERMLLVAYKSPVSPVETEQAVRTEPQVDWGLSDGSASRSFGGFQERRAATFSSNVAFCSDSYGRANVTLKPAEDKGAYVTVMVYPEQRITSCVESARSQMLIEDGISAPLLLLPEGSKLLDGGYAGRSGGTTSSSAVFSTTLPLATVLADLGEQMGQQGWKLDSTWSGGMAQGSSWSGPEEGSYGMLSLITMGDSKLKGIFHATELKRRQGMSSSAISISSSN